MKTAGWILAGVLWTSFLLPGVAEAHRWHRPYYRSPFRLCEPVFLPPWAFRHHHYPEYWKFRGFGHFRHRHHFFDRHEPRPYPYWGW
ncbi:MAG: hypothetical protein KatS3mg076_1301 [Candidatus Binatia bacterium]|nr:MAG: hypothetical protein KatS3mg076_1301 [Candidatus Binatia bacterium]